MKQTNRSMIIGISIGSIIIALLLGYLGYRWLFHRGAYTHKIIRTLALIKPDAVKALHTGKIIDRIEQEGFIIIDLRKVMLDREEAMKFYQSHQNKKFFNEVIDSMTSGPIVVMILEKTNAIEAWRELMGATDPAKAQEGTLRKQFGVDITRNAVHGSDSFQAAEREIKFFFADRSRDWMEMAG